MIFDSCSRRKRHPRLFSFTGGSLVTLRWNLRVAMAERGIFTMAELGRRMADRGNYSLTPPALHRLAGGKDRQPPKETRLATLNALLDALGFPTPAFRPLRY